MGGLGNQLFQVAATIALAKQYQDRAGFNLADWIKLGQGESPQTYLSTIYRNLDLTSLVNKCAWQETTHHYSPIPYRPGLKLIGFFQSERYFKSIREDLLKVFTPPPDLNHQLRSEYADILDRPNCSIHVRRGDFGSKYHPYCSLDYYRSAISLFPDCTTFIVCSDDLAWARQNFPGSKFVFTKNESSIYDLYLMSLCQSNIIANSTFSWWGAWLNQNPHRLTIAPRQWFGSGLLHLNTTDINTSTTIKI